jgi:hypothetical protein
VPTTRRVPRKRSSEVLALELPQATLDRLDWYARRLTKLLGIPASRSDAAFLATEKGLVQVALDFKRLDAATRKRPRGRKRGATRL